jgi:hypothetical protein
MKTVLEILKQAGWWHHGLSLKIENLSARSTSTAWRDRGMM